MSNPLDVRVWPPSWKWAGLVWLIIGLWLWLSAAKHDDMPPDVLLVAPSCLAMSDNERVLEWSDGRREEWVDYTATAEAKYSDDRPPWKLLLSKRTVDARDEKTREKAMIQVARDCADWVNAVKRAQERARAKPKR